MPYFNPLRSVVSAIKKSSCRSRHSIDTSRANSAKEVTLDPQQARRIQKDKKDVNKATGSRFIHRLYGRDKQTSTTSTPPTGRQSPQSEQTQENSVTGQPENTESDNVAGNGQAQSTEVQNESRNIKKGLKRWINEKGISLNEHKNRSIISTEIIKAYKNNSAGLVIKSSISHLPPEIGQLRALTSLSVHQTQLKHLPSEIGLLSALKELVLNENQLESLPATIGNLTALETLYLMGNHQLSSLPDEIGELTHLKKLYLTDSQISSLPVTIGQLKALEVLDLQGNQISRLPAEIGELKALEELRIKQNPLKDLPDSILEAITNYKLAQDIPDESIAGHKLKVDIEGIIQDGQHDEYQVVQQKDKLTGIRFSHFIKGLQSWAHKQEISSRERKNREKAIKMIMEVYSQGYEQLSLRGFGLSKLPAEISQLSSLRKLNLSNNQLNSLPIEIGQLNILKELNLSYNQFAKLPAEMGELISLRKLNLQYNQINHIDTHLLNRQIGVVTIDLHNNPLSNKARQILKSTSQLQPKNNTPTPQFSSNRQLPEEKGNEDFEKGMTRWANKQDLSYEQKEHRQFASRLILQAYKEKSQSLSLENLELTSLPVEISQLKKLKELNLNNNQLSKLTVDLSQLKTLTTLYIDKNTLISINTDLTPKNKKLRISLKDNLFSSETIQRLKDKQKEKNYKGPQLIFSDIDHIQTDNLTAKNLKEVLEKIGYITNKEGDLWDFLVESPELSDAANNITRLLAELYNQAPRENNQLSDKTRQHFERILSTLEQLYSPPDNLDTNDTANIKDILNETSPNALTHNSDHHKLSAAIRLLAISAEAQYYKNSDMRAKDDINIINSTINFVAQLQRQDIVFDKGSASFKKLFDIKNYDFTSFALTDKNKAILQLLNSGLLKSIEGYDLAPGTSVIFKTPQYLDEAQRYIRTMIRAMPTENLQKKREHQETINKNHLKEKNRLIRLFSGGSNSAETISKQRNLEDLASGLERWVNEEPSPEYQLGRQFYRTQRQQAKQRILEAYKNQSTELSLNKFQLGGNLPPEIFQLTALESLGLSNNGLTHLPPEIGQLTRLKALDLEGNQLQTLPEDIGQLTALEALSLKGNQLSDLPIEIGLMTSLERLDFSSNRLTTISADLGQLTQLQELSLENNLLATLPIAIDKLTALARLDLSYNQFTSLPAIENTLASLEILHIHNNKLTSLNPDIDQQLPNLRKLKLDNNRLKKLPEAMQKLYVKGLDFTAGGQIIYSREAETLEADLDQWVQALDPLDKEFTQRCWAKDQIINAYRHQSKELSLDGLALTSLPAEIGQLTHLKILVISSNHSNNTQVSQLRANGVAIYYWDK